MPKELLLKFLLKRFVGIENIQISSIYLMILKRHNYMSIEHVVYINLNNVMTVLCSFRKPQSRICMNLKPCYETFAKVYENFYQFHFRPEIIVRDRQFESLWFILQFAFEVFNSNITTTTYCSTIRKLSKTTISSHTYANGLTRSDRDDVFFFI